MIRPFAAGLTLMGLASVGACPARAQHGNSDFQFWPGLTVKAALPKRVELTTDLIAMCTAHCSRTGQALARAILDYRLSRQWSLGAGYTYFWADDGLAPRFKEHRVVQEINFQSSESKTQPVLSLRARLEERTHEGEDGTSGRLRFLTRLDLPLSAHGLAFIAWNEPFYVLNRTQWSGSPGFSFMLNFAGLGIPLSKRVTLESGYLNHTYLGAGDHRVRHIAAAFVVARP